MKLNCQAIDWEQAPNGSKACIEASTLGLKVGEWPDILFIEIGQFTYQFFRHESIPEGGFVYFTHPDIFRLTVLND
jgi:hypothetical protein